jgi:hypothetical protein
MMARRRAQIIVGAVGAFLILSGIYHLVSGSDDPKAPAQAPSSSSSPASS